MIDTRRSFKRGVLAVIGCLLIDVSVGEFNLLAFLYPYFSSYFHSFDSRITPASMALLPCIWLVAQIFSGLFSIKLYTLVGFKATFAIFLLVFFTGQMLASFITEFYLFCLVYGSLGGFAQGGLTILPLYCCWRYFEERFKSIISGIILSAYAIAPVGTSVLVLKLINPHNVSPVKSSGEISYFPAEVYQNVPFFLRVFGLVCLAVGSLGIALIQEPIEMEDDMENYAMEMSDHHSQVMRLSRQESPEKYEQADRRRQLDSMRLRKGEYEIKPMQAGDIVRYLQDGTFQKMYLIVFVGFLYPNFMLVNFKQIGLDRLEKPDKFLTVVGSIASIFNGASRLAIGLIFQHFGFKVAAGLNIFIEVTSALTFLPLADTKPTFAFSLCYFFNCYGGQLGLYPLVMHSLYKGGGALAYSLVFSGFTASCLLISLVHSYFTKLFGLGPVMIALGLVSVIPFMLVLKIHKQLEGRKALVIHSEIVND